MLLKGNNVKLKETKTYLHYRKKGYKVLSC